MATLPSNMYVLPKLVWRWTNGKAVETKGGWNNKGTEVQRGDRAELVSGGVGLKLGKKIKLQEAAGGWRSVKEVKKLGVPRCRG